MAIVRRADIEVAVQLAGCVLVVSRRPVTIQKNVIIDLPRPRDRDSKGYLEKRDHIFPRNGHELVRREGFCGLMFRQKLDSSHKNFRDHSI